MARRNIAHIGKKNTKCKYPKEKRGQDLVSAYPLMFVNTIEIVQLN